MHEGQLWTKAWAFTAGSPLALRSECAQALFKFLTLASGLGNPLQFYLSRHCALCDSLTRAQNPLCDICTAQPQGTMAILQVCLRVCACAHARECTTHTWRSFRPVWPYCNVALCRSVPGLSQCRSVPGLSQCRSVPSLSQCLSLCLSQCRSAWSVTVCLKIRRSVPVVDFAGSFGKKSTCTLFTVESMEWMEWTPCQLGVFPCVHDAMGLGCLCPDTDCCATFPFFHMLLTARMAMQESQHI
eukprot:561191-Pelagomonas_calceolata.AAC.1